VEPDPRIDIDVHTRNTSNQHRRQENFIAAAIETNSGVDGQFVHFKCSQVKKIQMMKRRCLASCRLLFYNFDCTFT